MSDRPIRNGERATANMVAEAANVSRAAVSRAFNPNASLKPEKRQRILKIAQELNYTPDMAARALVTRRSHLVGVIVPAVCSPWESQEIDALTTALQDKGFATLLFKTRADRAMDSRLLTYMKGFNLDSIVAFAENVRPDTLARYLDRAVPIYLSYPREDGELPPPFRESKAHFDRVEVLQRDGIEKAVALVQGYGGKRFAYLAGDTNTLANAERSQTFVEILQSRGLGEPVIIPGDFTYETAFAATIDLFRYGSDVDAIFAANDVSAFGAIDALRHELGLRVPEDVKVVGFDDIDQSAWRSYNLTTVKVDLSERVATIIRLILRRLDDPAAPAMSETIRTRLVVRGTVG
ncbi:LacI family DNA-binding transcriptional regulator [Martelella mediterranea]|uniref:LacI family DNA-binding transcriptional regulator n=1 Tax=Martelella mediterranea TaxID=293089 RepID=UPI001E4BA019|nr:LacI family DNA-binding transcriptional regulator [Martelella mediterranea]